VAPAAKGVKTGTYARKLSGEGIELRRRRTSVLRHPAYLVGMGLIVYLSDLGPLSNPVFPLWWDMLAVAVFSLAVYYWARAVAFPTERIERMIGQVVVPEEEEPAPLRRAA